MNAWNLNLSIGGPLNYLTQISMTLSMAHFDLNKRFIILPHFVNLTRLNYSFCCAVPCSAQKGSTYKFRLAAPPKAQLSKLHST